MRTLVQVNLKKDGNYTFAFFQNKDGTIEIKDFRIVKSIGDETGWKNGKSFGKIEDRFKILKANKFDYQLGHYYTQPEISEYLSDYYNKSQDKEKSMRKIIEIFEGYNCVGGNRIAIQKGNIQTNLKEWIDSFK